MNILLARNAGFCFGVEKAVSLTERLADGGEGPIYTLGQIIHNRRVTDRLEAKGVRIVEGPEGVERPGKLVIRAHGAPPALIGRFARADVRIYDATCPYVKKIHELTAKKSEEGCRIVIIGDATHPEVVGINGWCGGQAVVVDSPEAADALADTLDPSARLCVVAQTTLAEEFWNRVTERLLARFPSIELHKTICKATADRQKEAVDIAKRSDAMIVIGEPNSSNARKLYEICRKHCPRTHLVGGADDLAGLDLPADGTVGVTAGASVPNWVIDEVIDRLRSFS
jgi:4-hydroxy-3-methylbut-2-enyl diphosphate reductase